MPYIYRNQISFGAEDMKDTNIEHTHSTGNVYEDLGFSDAKDRLAKSTLAIKINDIIEKRGLTQKETALLLHVNQPKISALINGRLDGFSMERLIYFLNLLNQDIEIIVKPAKKTSHGRGTVSIIDK